jgi:hypothetical protein
VSFPGTAAADAPPTIEKVKPAAPKAGSAAFTRFEDCFTRGIFESSIFSQAVRVEQAYFKG